jgi:hypothetical protein
MGVGFRPPARVIEIVVLLHLTLSGAFPDFLPTGRA